MAVVHDTATTTKAMRAFKDVCWLDAEFMIVSIFI
jgi:hypothetical protein